MALLIKTIMMTNGDAVASDGGRDDKC